MFGLDDALEWAMAMEAAGAASEEIEAAMSRYPTIRKAISYGSKAGILKNAYKDVRGSFHAAQKGVKDTMSWGRSIRRDIRRGLARGGTIERRLGLRKRQSKSRAAAQKAARSRSFNGRGFKSFYPGVKPVAGIPTIGKARKFRKSKKIRRKPSKFAKRHYDDYGSLERDHCAYIGFQRHGATDRMWSIIGESLTKALLAKLKVYPRSYDEPLSSITHVDTLAFHYKRVAVPGGAEQEIVDTIGFAHDTTFEALAYSVSAQLKNKAERTDDADSDYAYYPFRAIFYNSANADHTRIVVQDLGESIIELYATQVITVKNLTPNDAGTTDLDVVGVNPIHGKKYEFNNFRPKLIDTIEENNPDLGAFYQVNVSTGINTAMSMPGAANADHIIAHPPPARQLFTNCTRATPISMGAGGVKVERTTFKMKHKLSTLIERIYYNQFDKGSFGGCTFFAFERKTRSVTGESRVKISFDRALHMSAYCKLAVKKSMLKHYDNNAIGVIADA